MREHDSVVSELLAPQSRLGVFGQSKPSKRKINKRVIKCVLNKMNGNPLKRAQTGENCWSGHVRGWELLFGKAKDRGSTAEAIVHHLHLYFVRNFFSTLMCFKAFKKEKF